ncbi:hypothetical protein GFL86_32520 [Rhizobium laguerreae]|nr:hypothetical protein [Rhizobium laguerreae]
MLLTVCRAAPSSDLRALAGAEPPVSTRPSDPRGEKRESRRRHESLLPSGRRWRQSDEGASRHAANNASNPTASGPPGRRRRLAGRWPG